MNKKLKTRFKKRGQPVAEHSKQLTEASVGSEGCCSSRSSSTPESRSKSSVVAAMLKMKVVAAAFDGKGTVFVSRHRLGYGMYEWRCMSGGA